MGVFDEVAALARSKGIDQVMDLAVSKIEVRDWVYEKARYCPSFGNCAYPPFSGGVQKARRILGEYRKAFVFVSPVPDEFRKRMVEIEFALSQKGFYRAFALVAGPSDGCSQCSPGNCRQKGFLRPSLESWGIDVVATLRRVKRNFLVGEVLPQVGIILLE